MTLPKRLNSKERSRTMSGNASKAHSSFAAAATRALPWTRGCRRYELLAGASAVATVAGVYIYLAIALAHYTV